MIKNRSRQQIISSILEEAEGKGGAKKTAIMYGAYLSVSQLNGYLDLLKENGMLEYTTETRCYHTTEKGANFRKVYDEVAQVLRPKEGRFR
ncbi:winged helix-turn-helix domain-containing protein [Nitrososphaera viennensis]|mgnify:FL=1|nr:winged helix-turn-helix domain-containing protein [Nitrososphaera viennensis]UVS68156.1 winged helix-turn-helix domain-containing protein [Nitrososphaera viennensis]